MEEIKGVNLSKLVEESSEELIADKRKMASGLVKQQLQRMEQLAIDIKNLKKQLRNKEEKLEKAQLKINKIKDGDWSLLVESKEEDQTK